MEPQTLHSFLAQVEAFLPKALLAVAIAFGGWLLAKAVRFSVVKALRSINFHILCERAGIDALMRMVGTEADTTAMIGTLVFWLAIVAALIVACNSLGLTYVNEHLSRILLFLPRVILAVVILVFGAYFARVVDDAVTLHGRNIGFDEAPKLGRSARYGIVFFVVLITVDELGIGGDIIRQSFLIILAGVVLALALAFGFGGRQWMADLLEHWWPQQKNEDKHGKE